MSAIRPPTLEPVPIATTAGGAPLAYAALGFSFHLEALASDDAARLTQASDRILAAIGPSLRWAWSSVHGEVEAFSAGALDLVASFPAQLADAGASALDDPRARAGTSAMNAAHYDKFGVACHGGVERNTASPWSLRFYSTIRPGAGAELSADAMLSLTVPLTTPLDELAALATAVAGDLRIRWGAAGLAYGAWELDRYGETRDAVYAHARRHPGFDVGQHATWMRAFHDRVRTVSWLTFLGKGLVEELGARNSAALASDELVTVNPCGDGVVLVAGERPDPGDVNRRRVSRAYAHADRRVRPVRAAEGIHFYAPWSASTTEAWLRRFEETSDS
ncbi:MAG: DUF3396 domain-containing protein [Labilithrix sp.]|nr:DUF3396 domain-containing protein [Labilithrix sp.]